MQRDAGHDAATPSVDADEDGVAQGFDCDDADPSVGATAEVDCANACGAGTSSCADGVWSVCSAPTDCLCDAPSAMRVVDCGNCGMQAQQCTGGRWEDSSLCLNEGACAPGTVENEENEYCEERQRLCMSSCEWADWTITRPAGECRRGTYECSISCSFGRGYSCDDECRLGPEPDTCPLMCD